MVTSKGWESNRAFVMLKSIDLIHWTSSVVNIEEKYPTLKDIRRVWAPQTIYDPEAGKYMVYWSIKQETDNDIIYYAYANDDFTDIEGEPKPLFIPKSGDFCIDGDIIYKDGLFPSVLQIGQPERGWYPAGDDKIADVRRMDGTRRFHGINPRGCRGLRDLQD